MRTYLFYDLETTGLNKAFDQILQFAAIRTDLNLKEIDRYQYQVKLNSDVIPSPIAMLTHGMSIAEMQKGISEFEAIKKIHALLNEPGTISLGYNTLGFDDEFLRFSFYRNLLPPYTHQFANSCSRMDLYPITVLYFLYKNSALIWPKKDGQPTLKLEYLNQANQLADGMAHNAMVDVLATVALTNCLRQENEMWEYVTGFFDKTKDQQRIQSLNHEGLMIDGTFGNRLNFQSAVRFIGNHYHYKNQSLWLRLDTHDFKENFSDQLWVSHKKLGEPGFILPHKERFHLHLHQERQNLIKQNQQYLNQHPQQLKEITHYHCDFKYPVLPNTDIDAALYTNGFWTDQENAINYAFHAAMPKEKSQLINEMTNEKQRELAIRIVGRHYPEALSASQQDFFSLYLNRIKTNKTAEPIIDFRGEARLTVPAALEIITSMQKNNTLNSQQLELLQSLQNYISS